MITGVDIVQMSIRIAAGEPIPYRQKDIQIRGHAIECRINAEDPDRDFMPSAGLIERYRAPGGLGVRIDSHVLAGYRVPPNYDSMIGKLICWADTREQAIERTSRALHEFEVGPIKTTIPLHRRLMQNTDFRRGGVDIHYLERLLKG
jgi:acetyl-CoA carboxylase biotin carboxylase subunit